MSVETKLTPQVKLQIVVVLVVLILHACRQTSTGSMDSNVYSVPCGSVLEWHAVYDVLNFSVNENEFAGAVVEDDAAYRFT